MVQVGRRRREAGRQPVRDRDRQGVDGGAVDHHRYARRDQGGGRRDGAGRRRGRGDRGRRRCLGQHAGSRRQGSAALSSKSAARDLRGDYRNSARRSRPVRSIRSSRSARHRATSARPRPRAARLSRRSPAGSPGRTASILRACRAPARAAASSPPISNPPLPRAAPAPRRSRLARRRRKSKRSTRASSSRRCRSTACARPSRGGWSRPSRPSRTSISSPM